MPDIIFRAYKYEVYDAHEPVILEKYAARDTGLGYQVTARLEGCDPRIAFLPKFSKEQAKCKGTWDHAFKKPLDALAYAENSVIEDLEAYEAKVAVMKDKLAQIEKLKLRHAKIKI